MRTAERARVFLDNMVWNALADGTSTVTVDELVGAYRGGLIEIVSTLEEYEEILGAARNHASKYRRMSKVWHRLCGKRILLPIKHRHALEVEVGGVVAGGRQYLPPSVWRATRRLTPGTTDVSVVNDAVFASKQTALTRDRAVRESILNEIDATGRKVSEFDRTVTESVIIEAVRDVLAEGAARGLPSIVPDDVEYERVPSLWLLVAATSARATRVAGFNRAVRDSDDHDRLHCSAGAYFDVLVTDDAEFAATLALVPDLPFEVVSSRELSARLIDGRALLLGE